MRLSLAATMLFLPFLALAQDAPQEAPTTKTLTSTLTRTFTVSSIASVTATRTPGVPYPSESPKYPSFNSTSPFYTATAPNYLSTGINTGSATSTASISSVKGLPTKPPASGSDNIKMNEIMVGAAGLLMILTMF